MNDRESPAVTTGPRLLSEEIHQSLLTLRALHKPYGGKPCQVCLVADGYAQCYTATVVAGLLDKYEALIGAVR